jgi:type VI secretion system secreted protein VgrG
VPHTVRLKDYNYRKPSLEVTADAVVDDKSSGEVYLYGEHFRSPEQGQRLAKIRAQELLCGKQTFNGESTVPYLSPGYTFTLGSHYRGSFNQKYLTVEMTHEGSQSGFLTAGLQQALSAEEKKPFYRNQFSAIPAGVQFRPAQAAHKPRITGTLNAKIDAAGSGKYAELDERGRYKVILPFDLSGRKDGKASAWLRMAQPYAGQDHGMHFPLHKGTEVLLTFIEGNPDRPVIAVAVPNTETPSPVTAADQTMAKITTSGGNKIHIEDQEGSQRILMQTPTAGTFLRLGSPNDPDSGHEEKDLAGAKLVTADAFKLSAGAKNEVIIGAETITVLGGHMKTVAPVKVDVTVGIETGLKIGGEKVFTPWHRNLHIKRTNVSAETTHIDETRNSMATVTQDFFLQKQEAFLDAIIAGEDLTEVTKQKSAATLIDNQVGEASTKLSETYTKMIQDHNKIVETENTVAQTVNTLGEAINTLAETVTVLAETDVAMAETQVSLADSYVVTAAEVLVL